MVVFVQFFRLCPTETSEPTFRLLLTFSLVFVDFVLIFVFNNRKVQNTFFVITAPFIVIRTLLFISKDRSQDQLEISH